MKQIVLTLLTCCISLLVQAQITDCTTDRYQQSIFNNIQVRSDITFGSAVNILGVNQSLEMDIYEPAPSEEYLSKRPLVVMLYGGAFIAGDKTDSDIVAWCDSLAHHGYVCAAVEYRLDNIFHFALPNQGVRAAYRAIQDAHAAVRYILEDPNNENFNVDPNYIYAGGSSAGAITAIHLGYMDDSERPAETFNVGFLDPDMGCIACSGNTYNQAFEVRGIIDLWGATLDLSYLDATDNIPMVIIHGDQDGTVPFVSGPPFGVSLFPTVYGAVPMDAELTTNGIAHDFYPYLGEGHVFYGSPNVSFPNQLWDPVFTQAQEFLYNRTLAFNSPVPTGINNVCAGDIITYQVPANSSSLFCWDAIGGTIVFSTANTVTVQWNSFPAQLTVTETTCVDVSGVPSSININSTPSSYSTANGNMLTGIQVPVADYETDGVIESDQLVQLDLSNPSATNVDYDSKTLICLQNDFEVTADVNFHAFIDGCGGQ